MRTKTLKLQLLSSKLLFVLAMLLLVVIGTITALVPLKQAHAAGPTINFQARLMNASGAIVPDGNYNVEFKMYSAASGGTALWNEQWLVTGSTYVRVANGYLTAALGTNNAFVNATTPIPWGQPLWLTMNIGGTSGTPSWDGEMSPRLALTAVPAALSLTGGSGSNTASLTFASTFTQPTAITLPDPGAGTAVVCYQTASACGFATGTGTGSYIQNAPGSQQAASFNIASASSTIPTALIQGASSGTTTVAIIRAGAATGDLLDIQDAGGTTNYVKVDSTGKTSTTKAISITDAGDATAFQVQGAATLFTVDTSNARVIVGTPASCTTGKLCVQNNVTLSGTTSVTNSYNLSTASGTPSAGSTIISQDILLNDTSSGQSNILRGIRIDFTNNGSAGGTNNALDNLNGLQVKLPDTSSSGDYTGNALYVTSATSTPTDVFKLNNAGKLSLQNTFDTSSAFSITNAAGTSTVFNIDTSHGAMALNARTTTDAATITLLSTSSIETNGLFINRNASGGTTSNGVNVTSTLGTLTSGVSINQTGTGVVGTGLLLSGTMTTGINIGSTNTTGLSFSGTNATDISRGSGILSLQGTGGVTISAAGTTTLAADTAGAGTVNLGNANATTIGIGAASGAATTIAGGNVAHTVHIADAGAGSIQGVTIGSTGSTSTLTLQAGTGTSTGDINIGDQTTAGKIIDIGSVDNAGTGTVHIATAAAVQAVTIGSTNSTSGTIIQGGTATGGGIQLNAITVALTAANPTLTASGTNTLTVKTADSASVATAALTLQSGNASTGTNLAAGTVTIDTGTTTGSGAAVLNVGNANAKTVTIGNTSAGVSIEASNGGKITVGDGNTAHTIQIGTGGTSTVQAVTVGSASTSAASTLFLQAGTGASALTLTTGATGGTAGGIVIGNTSGTNSQSISIGVNATATATNVIHIGDASTATDTITIGSANVAGNSVTINGGTGGSAVSIQAAATGTILIGSTNANPITLGGITTLSTLGTTNNSAYLCRNASGQIAACSTTATGTAFVQGGNAFGGTAILGTTDGNDLEIVTGTGGPNIRAYFDRSNNLYLGNGVTAAAPNDFVVSGTGSTTAGTAGGKLTIQGGIGTATGAGSVGGAISIKGGNAGAGSGNLAGGDVTLQGGTAVNTGQGGTLGLNGGNATTTGTNGTVSLDAGSGATTANGTVNLGTTNTNAINIGTGTQARTIFIGTNGAGGAVLQTIGIGTNSNAGGTNAITLGNTAATASTTTINGGTNNGTSTSGAVVLQAGTGGAINIGNTAASKSINIGSTVALAGDSTIAIGTTSANNTQAISIGANAVGGANAANNTLTLEGGSTSTGIQIGNSGQAHGIQIGTGAAVQTVTIGSTNSTSATTLQAGTGNLLLQTNSASASILARSGTNSTTAFEVQNAAAAGLLTVDTTDVNLILNSGGEVAFGAEWANYQTNGVASRTTTAGQFYSGVAGIQIVTGTTNTAGGKNNIGVALTNGTAYVINFWAKLTAAQTMTDLQVGISKDGTTGTEQQCGSNFTLSTAAWTHYSCTVTPNASGNTSAYVFFRQANTGTSRTFFIDNVGMTATTNTTTPSIKVGGNGVTTVLTLDQAAGAPTTTGQAAYLGSIFYNTTSGHVQCYEDNGVGGSWGDCGNTSLQQSYNNSTASPTPEIILDTTRNGIDIQDKTGTTIGATQGLLNVRGVGTATTLGASLFTVNASGQVSINNGGTTATPSINYDLSLGQISGVTTARTIGVEAQATAGFGGNGLTVSAGTANTTGTGGTLSLQGGAASATTGSSAGAVTISTQNAVNGAGATNGGTVGTLTLQGGNGGSGTGTNSTGANGGSLSFTAGNGGAATGSGTNGNGGNIALQAGSNGTGGTGTPTAGAITLTGGTALGAFAGGTVTLQGGTAAAIAGSTGGSIAITAANGSNTTTGGNGGSVTITAGNGQGSGGATNGGNIFLVSGTGVGGTKGAVQIGLSAGSGALVNNGTTTNTVTTQTITTGTTALGSLDLYSAFVITASNPSLTLSLGNPAPATAGRIIYISNASSSSNLFTLSPVTGSSISLNTGATATLLWNGGAWTYAGADASSILNQTAAVQSAGFNIQPATDVTAATITGATSSTATTFVLKQGTTQTGSIMQVLDNSSNAYNLFKVGVTGGFSSMVNADSATAFQFQNASGATQLNLDTTNTSSSLNLAATNGGGETSATFGTQWPSAGLGTGVTVSRDTTASEFASGVAGVKVISTTGASSGADYALPGGALTVSTTYIVSFSAKLAAGGTPSTFTDLDVRYNRTGTTQDALCTTGSAQTSGTNTLSTRTLVTTGWTKVTCSFVTSVTAGSGTANLAIIQTAAATTRTWFIDNLSIVAQATGGTQNVGDLHVGGAVSQGLTLLTLDTYAATPFVGSNASLAGSMYFDTTQNKIQCYDGSNWGACGAAPNSIITLTPEYAGAVLNGTGIGTLTSDFCANSAALTVGTLCAANDARNFYKWTSPQSTLQTYNIYVTYKLPATFKSFVAGTTSMTGLVDNTTNASLKYAIFKSTGSAITSCSALSTVVGWNGASTVGSANTWTQGVAGTLSGTTDPSTCGFVAGNNVIFQIAVSADNNASAYAENLNFQYANQ